MRNRSNKRQSKTIKIPPCVVNLTTIFRSILPHSKPAPSQTPTTQSISQTISRFIADLLFSVLLQLLFLLQVYINNTVKKPLSISNLHSLPHSPPSAMSSLLSLTIWCPLLSFSLHLCRPWLWVWFQGWGGC